MHYSGKRSVNFIVRASFAIKMSQVTLLLTGTLSRILSRYNSWSRIDISSETFFMACHLAEITPFFLHFVIGMGIKHSSKDEDFMSCYSTFTPENNGPASSLSGGEAQGNSLWGEYSLTHPLQVESTTR